MLLLRRISTNGKLLLRREARRGACTNQEVLQSMHSRCRRTEKGVLPIEIKIETREIWSQADFWISDDQLRLRW